MSKRDNPVTAARSGDRRAQEELARTYLPLVYNVVGRALNGHPDVEDVVQETMLRVIRDLPGLRQPESVRAWILAIALHQIGVHRQRAESTARVTPVAAVPGPATDFEEIAIMRLRLTGERRQVAEASRWLDDEDRGVLALWWQEAAGELTRAEVATAMDTGMAYAAVRIQRMRVQLDRCRTLVAALEAQPRCPVLTTTVNTWDGRPSPLWRKRIDRHVRDCRTCLSRLRGEIPVDRLLVGCALVPVPASVAPVAAPSVPKSSVKTLVASVVAAAVVVAGGVSAYAAMPEKSQPTAQPAAVTPSVAPVPSASASAAPTSKASKTPTTKAVPAASVAGCVGKTPARRWAAWPMPTEKTAKYKNQGDGTVRDTVTCLDWQRAAAPDVYTFTEAKAYCANLKLDGGGWHLPTRIELISIVDTSRSGPAIDTTAFPGTPAKFFWTSTPWAVTKTPLRAWIVNFYEGLASNGAFQTGEFQARCVRSASTGSGKPAYRIAAGQVTDPETGLTWQRATSKSAMAVSTAAGYCTALKLGGKSWRLPTVQELSTTVDDSRVAPAIDPAAFPDTIKSGWYWTASKADPEPAKRWALNYLDGFTNYRSIETGYVRCVS